MDFVRMKKAILTVGGKLVEVGRDEEACELHDALAELERQAEAMPQPLDARTAIAKDAMAGLLTSVDPYPGAAGEESVIDEIIVLASQRGVRAADRLLAELAANPPEASEEAIKAGKGITVDEYCELAAHPPEPEEKSADGEKGC